MHQVLVLMILIGLFRLVQQLYKIGATVTLIL